MGYVNDLKVAGPVDGMAEGWRLIKKGLRPIRSESDPTYGPITSFRMLCIDPIMLMMVAVRTVSFVTIRTSCPEKSRSESEAVEGGRRTRRLTYKQPFHPHKSTR